jgi:hypothetical protein
VVPFRYKLKREHDMDEKLVREIRDYTREHGGWQAIQRYGEDLVRGAWIPED